MSTFRGSMSDARLNELLDHWLSEGPETVPDRVVDGAVKAAIATGQRQWRGWLLRTMPSGGPAIVFGISTVGVAAAILLAVGLGLWRDAQPGIVPTPSPGASAYESDSSTGTLYRNAVDGYEILVPGDWEVDAEPVYRVPGVVRFDGRTTLGETSDALIISIGATDGSVQICDGPACVLRVVRSLDELGEAILSTRAVATDGSGFAERTDETTLDGEPARFEYPVTTRSGGSIMGFQARCSVYAFHEGRPVILSFACNHMQRGAPAGQAIRQAIIGSFRFLGEPESSSGATVSLEFPDAGFRISAPRDAWVTEESADYVRVEASGMDLQVRVGDASGRIVTCEQPGRAWERCRDETVTTLDEFRSLVEMGPVWGCTGLCAPVAQSNTTTLGGADALRIRIFGYEYPAQSGENALYVLAFDERRPYFLRLYTSSDFAPGTRVQWDDGPVWTGIVDSFAFLD